MPGSVAPAVRTAQGRKTPGIPGTRHPGIPCHPAGNGLWSVFAMWSVLATWWQERSTTQERSTIRCRYGARAAALLDRRPPHPLGLLEPGDRLPTAQQVVAALAINPNTVLKAYRELEREGLVQARPGLGTFVTGRLQRTDPVAQARFRRSLTAWLRSARDAGLTPEEIEAIYRTAYRAMFTRASPGPAGCSPASPSSAWPPSPPPAC